MSVNIVTGATGEIGSAIVKNHLKNGRQVVSISKSTASLDDDNVEPMLCDLTDEKAVAKLLLRIGEQQEIDSLVVSHGATLEQHFLTTQPERFMEILNLNVATTIRIVREVARSMAKKRNGKIIVVGSSVTARMQYGNLAYATSKYALLGFCKGLALEMVRFNVGVYNVAPGLVPSRLSQNATDKTLSQAKDYRLTSGESVAEAVEFLLCNRGTLMSGEVVYVNDQMDHL